MIIKKIDPVHGGVFPGRHTTRRKYWQEWPSLPAMPISTATSCIPCTLFMAWASTAAKKWSGICKAVRRPMATPGQHNGRCTSPFPARDRRRTKSKLCRHRTCRDARVWHGQTAVFRLLPPRHRKQPRPHSHDEGDGQGPSDFRPL